VVATFTGKSQMQMLNPKENFDAEKLQQFDRDIQSKSSLDQAGYDSWALVRAMRAKGIEAFVFHDRYRSIVTVGDFESLHDPRVKQLIEKYRAKYTIDPKTKKQFLTCEAIDVAGPPPRMWLLDPLPQVMEVPRLR
jgi:hypothetical protein